MLLWTSVNYNLGYLDINIMYFYINIIKHKCTFITAVDHCFVSPLFRRRFEYQTSQPMKPRAAMWFPSQRPSLLSRVTLERCFF